MIARSTLARTSPPERCDLIVVGAGIIGLAVARELLARHPDLALVVLEREEEIAAHQSGHNSGVMHAGIYYEPGSLKAELCVRGARALREYCAERDIPISRCGKLIVARRAAELPGLAELERRAGANGVPGVRRIGVGEIAELEPHCTGLEALVSPSTAVVDFTKVAEALAADVIAAGGKIVTGCEVRELRRRGSRIVVFHRSGARRPAICSPAPAPGPIALLSGPARPRSRASCRSAAPTCG